MVVLGALSSAAMARAASVAPSDFTLLSADGSSVIGRAHFEMAARAGGPELVQGRYQFNNGEYDVDEDWLEMRPGKNLPALLRYKHAFFHRDGSPDRVSEADLESGHAACTIYVNGRPDIQSAKLAFSPDTYAGPAVTLPIREFIRRGSTGRAEFRDFSCAPGPKIYTVSFSVEWAARWTLHPGQLVRVDIQPDLGRLTILVAPLLPKIRLWFDPAKDFELIGAESSRYYKGLHFIMVRDVVGR